MGRGWGGDLIAADWPPAPPPAQFDVPVSFPCCVPPAAPGAIIRRWRAPRPATRRGAARREHQPRQAAAEGQPAGLLLLICGAHGCRGMQAPEQGSRSAVWGNTARKQGTLASTRQAIGAVPHISSGTISPTCIQVEVQVNVLQQPPGLQLRSQLLQPRRLQGARGGEPQRVTSRGQTHTGEQGAAPSRLSPSDIRPPLAHLAPTCA